MLGKWRNAVSELGERLLRVGDSIRDGYAISAGTLYWLASAADEQSDRVERVLALHRPRKPRTGVGVRGQAVCEECSAFADKFDEVEWPCETVRILTGDEQARTTDGP